MLRELCDDRLNKETNGEHESYGGGSFQWWLTKLEERGFLKCKHIEKRETTIIPDINRIEYFLQRQKLESSFDKVNQRIIETNVEDSILEEIIEEVYCKLLDRAIELKYHQEPSESYYAIRKFIASFTANVMSRAFEFNISYDPTTKIQPNKEFIMAIATQIFNIVERDPEAPLSVKIDYKGMSMPSMEVLPRYEPAFSPLFIDCFLIWTKSTYNYTVCEEDIRKLREGNNASLSESALEYYGIFCHSVVEYLSLIKSTKPYDHITRNMTRDIVGKQ